MRSYSKLLLMTLLLACSILLFSSCAEGKDYEYLVEEELIPTLEKIEEAYTSPSSYFETRYEDSIEDAWGKVSRFFDGEDVTQEEAEKAFKVIMNYINYLRDSGSDLLTFTKKYYVD